jgi:DNA polymerase I
MIDRRQASLFDALEVERLEREAARYPDWKPAEPPQICSRGIKDIVLNFETTGLRWWEDDRPISAACRLPDGSLHYISWGHRGGNIDEATAKRWAQRELRDCHITNSNTKFDVHQAREWGVDLEAQNCTVSDVQHYAALLDDWRKEFALDILIQDLLGEQPMARLDESRMTSYHAAEAAPRAMYNVEMVHRLRDKMWPMLDEQDLQRVRALEDQVIFPVCEMEKNGAPIDLELLDRWIVESQKKYEECLWKLTKMCGFQVNPKSPKRMWEHFKLPMEHLPSGNASFTDEIIKAQMEHPAVVLLRYARKLATLRSNYLLKYKRVVDSKGIIRYALHQLRSQKDPLSDYGEAGTVTGRFASSRIAEGVGLNIQQEMKAAKQRVAFGYDEKDDSHDDEIFIVRQLRIPPAGRRWCAADARQIEYRIFASYAGNPEVIEAYRQNPLLSFHEYMHERIRPFKPDQTYRQQKDLNFAYVYGAGLTKQAKMLGHITQREFDEIRRKKDYDNPKLKPTKEVRRIYAQELPEVEPLLKRASHIAKPKCDKDCYDRGGKLTALHQTEEHRGYVRTILGRRMRFPTGQRLHKAFNGIDQGSAADIMKQKLVELHAERKYTGLTMRYTVHDEVDGDTPDDPTAELRVAEVLDRQSFPELKVPILWEVKTGRNWKECA